jgi:ParB family transcriptional regulator, chromosome partitioning protein
MSRRRDDLRAFFAGEPAADAPAPETKAQVPQFLRGGPAAEPPRPASGALKAMGLELDGLRQAADEAERLRRQLTSGEMIVEIDPALVDAAFVRDRMEANSAADAALEASLSASGQQVPVLVRPHPTRPGRYEAVYGHRRIAALGRLGRPVSAIVRAMDDDALVIAQGQENNQRQDLSFVERARFAAALDGRGFDRRTIKAALDAHSADITRYLNVVAGIPDGVIAAIGPAPKAGRARWMALAKALGGRIMPADLREIIADPAFRGLDSDRRFAAVMAHLTRRPKPPPAPEMLWRSPDGGLSVAQLAGRGGAQLRLSGPGGAAFAGFIARHLADLHARFTAEHGEPPAPDSP